MMFGRLVLTALRPLARDVQGARQMWRAAAPTTTQQSAQPRILFAWSRAHYATTAAGDVGLSYDNGRAKLKLPLPSAGNVVFTMHSAQPVRQLVSEIVTEDDEVTFAEVRSPTGDKFSGSTPLGVVLAQPFELVVNGRVHKITPPADFAKAQAGAEPSLAELRAMVESLHAGLDTPEQQHARAAQLQTDLEALRAELKPMEEICTEIEKKAGGGRKRLAWVGLAGFSFIWGFLARLTWWDYSWDLMEPVTFFITYGTSVGFMAYYVITSKEYDYEVVGDRKFAKSFHKMASRRGLDLGRLEELRQAVADAELRLRTLPPRL